MARRFHIPTRQRVGDLPIEWAAGLEMTNAGFGVLHKFGFGTVSTTFNTIWDVDETLYGYLSAAQTLKVSSSDVDDTAAGAGARTLRLYGLDTNRAEIQEDISLNGQTVVNTANEYLRVFRAKVLTAGASDGAEGDIYVGDGVVTLGVPATKYLKITSGEDQTLMALYTVPAGKKLLITQLFLSSSKNEDVTLRMMFREIGGVFQVKWKQVLYQRSDPIPFGVPIVAKAGTDIELQAKSTVGTAIVAGDFGGALLTIPT